MEQDHVSAFYITANVVAVFSVVSAVFWPTISRVLLSAIFVGAFALNLFTAIMNPSAYLEFGEFSTNDFYRSLILGPFSSHAGVYVIMIAVCQLLIGIFICYRGKLMKTAMAGAITFLVAIIPLGNGAAFPAPLIMALAFFVLLSKRIRFNIYEIIYNTTS